METNNLPAFFMCVQLILSLAYNFIVCENIICYAYYSVFLPTFLKSRNLFFSVFKIFVKKYFMKFLSVLGHTGIVLKWILTIL
jgi:hypothetical protein